MAWPNEHERHHADRLDGKPQHHALAREAIERQAQEATRDLTANEERRREVKRAVRRRSGGEGEDGRGGEPYAEVYGAQLAQTVDAQGHEPDALGHLRGCDGIASGDRHEDERDDDEEGAAREQHQMI